MLRIRDIEFTLRHSTLYLRRHNDDTQLGKHTREVDHDRMVELSKVIKLGARSNGGKHWNMKTAVLAVMCCLLLVAEWKTPTITNLSAYEHNLISFLRTEAGLAADEETEENDFTSGCDYSRGMWVKSNRAPLYSGEGCTRWLALMWACRRGNRTDFEYENFRWQPEDCDLPTFNAKKFLRRMRSKTIAFVGDSIGRQQFQSLMCLLTGGRDNERVEDVGAFDYGFKAPTKTSKSEGWAYRFQHTNTTIVFYWSATLCDLQPLNETDPFSEIAIHVDRPASFLTSNLHRFDILIINTGPHWNANKFIKNRWKVHMQGKRTEIGINQDMNNLYNSNQEINNLYNFTVHRVVGWLNEQLEKGARSKVLYRTLSPRHFFHGEWDSGGRCDNTHLTARGQRVLKGPWVDAVAESAVRGTRISLINITSMSQLRDEAHISKYSLKAKNGSQDCLHWCLPGVPDTWNQILYAQTLQTQTQTPSPPQQQLQKSG